MRTFLIEIEESVARYSKRKDKKVRTKILGTAENMTITITIKDK